MNSPVSCSIQITGLGKHELKLGGSTSSSSAHPPLPRLMTTLRKYPTSPACKAVWTEGYWHPTLSAESLLRNFHSYRATGSQTHRPVVSRKHEWLQHRGRPTSDQDQAPCPGSPKGHQASHKRAHRGHPKCFYYQDVLAAAGRCTEAHACMSLSNCDRAWLRCTLGCSCLCHRGAFPLLQACFTHLPMSSLDLDKPVPSLGSDCGFCPSVVIACHRRWLWSG